MSKAPWLTESVKDRIRAIHLENPDWKQTKVRKELLKRLSGDSQYEPGWPKLASVKSVLTEIREKEGKLTSQQKELDGPWSLSTAIRLRIPSDAAPTLIRIQNSVREMGMEFTIREALWVAYLYKIPALNPFDDNSPSDFQLFILSMIAKLYSMREAVKTIAGSTLDTSDLDTALGDGEVASLVVEYFRERVTLPYNPCESDADLMRLDGPVLFFHHKLGLPDDIPIPTFAVSSNSEHEYLLWLSFMLLELKIKGLDAPPKEVQQQFVLSLQQWIKENEPDFKFKLPPPISTFPLMLTWESMVEERKSLIKKLENEHQRLEKELDQLKLGRQMEVEQILESLNENIIEIKHGLEEVKLKLLNPD